VAQETDDHEDEVTDITPTSTALTQDRYKHVVTLFSHIQGNNNLSKQSTLQVLLSGGRQTATVVATHPSNSDLLLWAHRQGCQEPDSYKSACETAGISYNTYLYLDEENGLVCTTTYEPWNILSKKIHRKFLKLRCAILTNNSMLSYRGTQLGVILCEAKSKDDTYSCVLTRCNIFIWLTLCFWRRWRNPASC
jgi:hypothetical protein